MLTSIPRLVRWAVVLAVLGAVAAAVFQSWRADYSAGAVADGWTETQFGPVGPADRELLTKVRLAGLWEMPTGQEMQQRATSQRVQEVGRLISTEHEQLDAIVRDAAAKLGVVLPNQPSEEQQGWMAEITASSGTDYDKVAINRLRAAHGKVLPIISAVRAGTRNDLVRKFAITSAEFVNRHHNYLESTGLVDFSALPEAQPSSGGPPVSSPIDKASLSTGSSGPNVGLAAVVFIAAMLAIVGLVAYLRSSSRRRRDRAPISTPAHSRPIRRVPPLALTAAPEERGPRHAARR